MKKTISSLPEYQFAMCQQLGRDDYAVLLSGQSGFAVCRMQPQRRVALSPNYHSDGRGIISGPLSPTGLSDLLQWTNRDEAVSRFRRMAGLPDNVVPLCPAPRPPE